MKNKNLQKAKLIFVFLLTLAGMTNSFAQEFTIGKLKYEVCGNKYDLSLVKVIGHVDEKKAQGELIIPDTVFWEGKKKRSCSQDSILFF